MNFEITGESYLRMLRGGAAALHANRQTVNELNVFPVPDGDTGDNMYMTLRAGCQAASPDGISLGEAASGAAQGMLYSARGNSGVILSRIFSGLAKGLAGTEIGLPEDFAKAAEDAITEAYGAVKHPVEGTILTVFRDSVRYADGRIRQDEPLEAYLDDLIEEAKRALERTPDQLPTLKEAGVVDSGGAGLLYILCGMRDAVDREIALPDENQPVKAPVDLSGFTADSELEFGYCTEFLLQLQSSKIDLSKVKTEYFNAFLEENGDSVVAFLEGSIFKVHVHTHHPGDILNYFQQFGEFLTLKIENMTLQHNETVIRNTYVPPKTKKHFAVVAVAAGEGVRKFFTDLGADAVVDGGQSMNPSAEDFIKAYRDLNAEHIFVLPNNPNIILAAEQSAKLYQDADIIILPTKTVGEGYAALSVLDRNEKDLQVLIETAEESMAEAKTFTVSMANRDTVCGDVQVVKDQYIGFADKKIYVCSPDRREAAEAMLSLADAGKADIMLAIIGKDVPETEADALISSLEAKMKRKEIIRVNGGQPIYDYIFVTE